MKRNSTELKVKYHKGNKPSKKFNNRNPRPGNMGQWANPGVPTEIPSGNITMQGVPYPVKGIDNFGNEQIMMPGADYVFPGSVVTEIPMAKSGGWLDKYQGTKYSGETEEQENPYVNDPYIGMRKFYDQAYEKLNKYLKKDKDGILSNFDKIRAWGSAAVKNPQLLFRDRYSLTNPGGPLPAISEEDMMSAENNPYRKSPVTVKTFQGISNAQQYPTDYVYPNEKDAERYMRYLEKKKAEQSKQPVAPITEVPEKVSSPRPVPTGRTQFESFTAKGYPMVDTDRDSPTFGKTITVPAGYVGGSDYEHEYREKQRGGSKLPMHKVPPGQTNGFINYNAALNQANSSFQPSSTRTSVPATVAMKRDIDTGKVAANKKAAEEARAKEIASGKGKEKMFGVVNVPVTYSDVERQNAETLGKKKLAAQTVQGDVYQNLVEAGSMVVGTGALTAPERIYMVNPLANRKPQFSNLLQEGEMIKHPFREQMVPVEKISNEIDVFHLKADPDNIPYTAARGTSAWDDLNADTRFFVGNTYNTPHAVVDFPIRYGDDLVDLRKLPIPMTGSGSKLYNINSLRSFENLYGKPHWLTGFPSSPSEVYRKGGFIESDAFDLLEKYQAPTKDRSNEVVIDEKGNIWRGPIRTSMDPRSQLATPAFNPALPSMKRAAEQFRAKQEIINQEQAQTPLHKQFLDSKNTAKSERDNTNIVVRNPEQEKAYAIEKAEKDRIERMGTISQWDPLEAQKKAFGLRMGAPTEEAAYIAAGGLDGLGPAGYVPAAVGTAALATQYAGPAVSWFFNTPLGRTLNLGFGVHSAMNAPESTRQMIENPSLSNVGSAGLDYLGIIGGATDVPWAIGKATSGVNKIGKYVRSGYDDFMWGPSTPRIPSDMPEVPAVVDDTEQLISRVKNTMTDKPYYAEWANPSNKGVRTLNTEDEVLEWEKKKHNYERLYENYINSIFPEASEGATIPPDIQDEFFKIYGHLMPEKVYIPPGTMKRPYALTWDGRKITPDEFNKHVGAPKWDPNYFTVEDMMNQSQLMNKAKFLEDVTQRGKNMADWTKLDSSLPYIDRYNTMKRGEDAISMLAKNDPHGLLMELRSFGNMLPEVKNMSLDEIKNLSDNEARTLADRYYDIYVKDEERFFKSMLENEKKAAGKPLPSGFFDLNPNKFGGTPKKGWLEQYQMAGEIKPGSTAKYHYDKNDVYTLAGTGVPTAVNVPVSTPSQEMPDAGPLAPIVKPMVAAGIGIPEVTVPATVPVPQKSFSQAFKDARNAGLSEFTWQGKKYGTKYSSEVQPKEKVLVPVRTQGEKTVLADATVAPTKPVNVPKTLPKAETKPVTPGWLSKKMELQRSQYPKPVQTPVAQQAPLKSPFSMELQRSDYPEPAQVAPAPKFPFSMDLQRSQYPADAPQPQQAPEFGVPSSMINLPALDYGYNAAGRDATSFVPTRMTSTGLTTPRPGAGLIPDINMPEFSMPDISIPGISTVRKKLGEIDETIDKYGKKIGKGIQSFVKDIGPRDEQEVINQINNYNSEIYEIEEKLQELNYKVTDPDNKNNKKDKEEFNQLVQRRKKMIDEVNDIKSDIGFIDRFINLNFSDEIVKPLQKGISFDDENRISFIDQLQVRSSALPKMETYQQKRDRDLTTPQFENLSKSDHPFERFRYRIVASNSKPIKVALYGTRGERGNSNFEIKSKGAIMHFLDQSPLTGYVHPNTMNMYKSLKENDYVGYLKPTGEKSENGQEIYDVTYERKKNIKGDITKNTYLLRQMKFDDIDFNNKVKDSNFAGHKYWTNKKTGKQALPISIAQDSSVYDYSSGQSVVYIFEYKGETMYLPFAGSPDEIKKEGERIKKDYKLNEGNLTIGLSDAGSYSSSVRGNITNELLNDKSYGYYNLNEYTGAGMALVGLSE